MKELYTKPELEIEVFATEDIITASDNDGGWLPGWNTKEASEDNGR